MTLSEQEYHTLNTHLLPTSLLDWSSSIALTDTLLASTAAPVDLVTRILNDDSGKVRLRRWLQSKIDAVAQQAHLQQQQAQQQAQNAHPSQQQYKQRSFHDLLSYSSWFSAANLLRGRLVNSRNPGPELEMSLLKLRSGIDPELHISIEYVTWDAHPRPTHLLTHFLI